MTFTNRRGRVMKVYLHNQWPRYQGSPGQMTRLEERPPWLKPCVLLCFGNSVNRK